MGEIQQEIPEQPVEQSSKRSQFVLLGILVLLLCGALYFLSFQQKSLTQNKQPDLAISPSPEKSKNDFFYFTIPKPISMLTKYDLPNDGAPQSFVLLDNHVWFTSGGSIIEYDIATKKIVSYSNAKQANCDRDIVTVPPYIFVSCRIDNVEDAFGEVRELKTEIYTGHYGVYKIDPKKHTVEHIFSKKDGLLNGYNYELYPDGVNIWIATFNGVGKINSRTNHVDFYTDALGFKKANITDSPSINAMLIDKEYVWAWAGANAKSLGGGAVYNKADGTWKAFGPNEIKKEDFGRLDLEFADNGFALKRISGGIQIGFRDGRIGDYDKFVESQYDYQTGTWAMLSGSRIATGEDYEQTSKYVSEAYKGVSNTITAKADQDGLVQLHIPELCGICQLDGRDNLILSPVIDNKRYILTNSTIDVIDEASQFRTIVVKIGTTMSAGVSVFNTSDDLKNYINFLVDPQSLFAIVADSSCEGMGCIDEQKVWLVDLKAKKINKLYTKADGITGEMLSNIQMKREGEELVISTKDQTPQFSVNTSTSNLTILNKNILTPGVQ